MRAFVEHVDRTKVLTARSIMRRPESVVHSKDGPALAVKRMRESGTSTLFVTNQARKLVGLVRIEDTLRLMAENKHSLEGALVTDLPTTSPDTPLAKLVAVAATTQIPIAVVSEDQSFLGIVSRAALLSSIAGEQG